MTICYARDRAVKAHFDSFAFLPSNQPKYFRFQFKTPFQFTVRKIQHRSLFTLRSDNLYTVDAKFTRNEKKKKTKDDFFRSEEVLRRRKLENEDELIFAYDNRKFYLNLAILSIVQFLFAIVAANLLYNFAKIRIEKEHKEGMEKDYETLKGLEESGALDQKTKEQKEAVREKILELEENIKHFADKHDYISSFQVLYKMHISEFVKFLTPLIFSGIVLIVVRAIGIHNIRQIDLLPGGKQVRVSTYKYFGQPQKVVLDIPQIYYKSTSDKFVMVYLPDRRFASLINVKDGMVFNPDAFTKITRGTFPRDQSVTGGDNLKELLKQKFAKK